MVHIFNEEVSNSENQKKREKILDDIYSTSFKLLSYLDRKSINKKIVEDKVLKSLNTFGIKKESFLDFQKCIDNLYKNYSVTVSRHSTLSDNQNHVHWYDPLKKRPYWDTHKHWLTEKNKKPVDVVSSIDKATDEIMTLLENPAREGIWDRRGMVVGNVQSGKTSNFIALANKALDAGYKFIIILSGLTKDLRRQTHERLDEGFFGFNTELEKFTGFDSNNILPLGTIRKDEKLKWPNTYTTSALDGDLTTAVLRSAANTHTQDATLLCVKKNKTSLENLIKYVCSNPEISEKVFCKHPFSIETNEKFPFIRDKPILVIDDEVDHASVDTGEQEYDENDNPEEEYNPKTINKLIRTLLNLYERKCYIGYTATPFANVFIHPSGKTKKEGPDLFPKNFILNLPEPSNYYGIKKLFSDNKEDVEDKFLEEITDHCSDPNDIKCYDGWIPPKHFKDHAAFFDGKDNHPTSLKRAILSFIVSCSIRNLRGQSNDHKSMLIHVSKYILVNKQVKIQVIKTLDSIRSILLNKGTEEYNLLKKEMIKEIENFSTKDKCHLDDLLDFDKGINYVVSEISLNIKNLSGNSDDILDYEIYRHLKNRGLQTIVIGGDRLSRGITLEGLSVSYFLRSSKMYDTLMQMGRWFGYREGYYDLCKLFTTNDLIDWFYFIAEATEELRAQFKIMSELKQTPSDFGLKVKSHPLLMITSRVKMRHGQSMKSSFADHFGQTTSFDLSLIDQNYKITENFISSIGKPSEKDLVERPYGNEKKSFVWKNVSSKKIINFLTKYKVSEEAILIKPYQYAEYIKNLNSLSELEKWTVGLMGGGSSNKILKINKTYEVNLLKRKARKPVRDNKYSIGVLTNPNHQMLDLKDDQILQILNEGAENKDYGVRARQLRNPNNGLLLLYPINKTETDKKSKSEACFGYAISFPSKSKTKSDESNISYKVNNVYLKKQQLQLNS